MPKKLKFSYMEQREYESIEGEVAELEGRLAALKAEQERAASDYLALQRLQKEQEELEQALEEKMERWLYLSDLAERIEQQ